MFNDKFYTYWKNMIEIFIKAENYQVWRVIETGDFEITATNDKNEVVPKLISDYDKEYYHKLELNALAIKYLHCGLGPQEHNRIMGCKYERFEMQSKESIEEMFTRFNDIINELNSLGRHIPIDEQTRKILRSLPQDKRWRSKVTAMQEAKDFTKFNMEQLAGSLVTHELHLSSNTERSKNKSLALKRKINHKARLEGELEKSRKGKQPVGYRVPVWITKAQTKRTEGLGFKKKFQKEKKYVDLPSSIVCYFCGSTGHKQIPVRGNNTCYLDSGCSKHMTGDKSRFISLDAYYGGTVTFGDNMTGVIVPIGKVGRIIHNDTGNIILEGNRKGNTYVVDLNERFGRESFTLLDKLRSKELVEGFPCIKFLYEKVCDAFVSGKHTRISFKSMKLVSTKRPLELVHMDLCGPMRIQSTSGKRYVMKEQRRTGNPLIHLRSDHGTEFKNLKFDEFCTEHGMDHNFSAPRTPQKNGVVKRKNRSLEDMARTMLISSGVPRNFWAEAVNTACYILNRVSVRAITNKTPYELIKGRKPNISYFRYFGCKCFVNNNGKRNLGKFDERSVEAVFLGYVSNSKAI
ncbi:uncharacterized protein LOC110695459 [Chenopodium quinoa]|uniref:uncharacterized protein LOC110695459 n=1 Tax=Chenopodium quinoa TaxID=63459 RepID=UPI000B76DE9C|nr:uncharacterized protein LOC110695459 [Chenopodium quinoa]